MLPVLPVRLGACLGVPWEVGLTLSPWESDFLSGMRLEVGRFSLIQWWRMLLF